MKSLLLSSCVSLTLLVQAGAAGAQRRAEPTGPGFHKLVSLDSAGVAGGALSPNQRWLLLNRGDNAIWITGVGGRRQVSRLLSPGHTDRVGTWFASSDKIVFLSNRPSREGPDKLYVTTVAIDPTTGDAVGAPRQVSTEAASALGRPSPDGRWIPYVTVDQQTLKLVPAIGGTPRTLAEHAGIRAPILWSTDGTEVYFPAGAGPFSPKATWFRVPAAGGTVTALEPGIIPNFPNPEQHLRFTYATSNNLQGVRRAELLDGANHLLGVIDVPPGMSFFPTIGGPLGVANASVFRNHVTSVSSGTSRLVGTPDEIWVDGWRGDGSGFVADGGEVGSQYLALVDTTGRVTSRLALPADARAEGWEGVVGSATTFRRGTTRPGEAGNALYAGDVRTGSIHELSPHTVPIAAYVSGRGGEPQDSDRFILGEPTPNGRALKAVTLDGRVERLRTFNATDTLAAAAVHGERVAWVRETGDSLILFVSNHATSPAQRVEAWRAVGPASMELAWSRDGSHLAALGSDIHAKDRRRVSIRVWRFAQGRPVGSAVTEMHPDLIDGWSMRWVDGDRALALIAGRADADKEHVYLLPIASPDEARLMSPEDESQDEWFQVSPDERQIVYPESKPIGSAIWRMDFVPTASASRGGRKQPH